MDPDQHTINADPHHWLHQNNLIYDTFFILSYLRINLLLAGVVGLYGSIRLLLRCPWIRRLGGPWTIYRHKFRVEGCVVVLGEDKLVCEHTPPAASEQLETRAPEQSVGEKSGVEG